MLIINNNIQVEESGEIYERDNLIRDKIRRSIQITIKESDTVNYNFLCNTFKDGISIVRQIKSTRIESKLVKVYDDENKTETSSENTSKSNETNSELENVEDNRPFHYKTVEETIEDVKEYDLSKFNVAGDIVDKRNGMFTIYMGIKTEEETLEEENAELLLSMIGVEE